LVIALPLALPEAPSAAAGRRRGRAARGAHRDPGQSPIGPHRTVALRAACQPGPDAEPAGVLGAGRRDGAAGYVRRPRRGDLGRPHHGAGRRRRGRRDRRARVAGATAAGTGRRQRPGRSSHAGDGTKLAGYYAFDAPLLASIDGVVVYLSGALPDRPPAAPD